MKSAVTLTVSSGASRNGAWRTLGSTAASTGSPGSGTHRAVEVTGRMPYGVWPTAMAGSGPRGRDFYDKPDGELLHLTNWVECMRSRKDPTAPVAAGVSAAAAAHLANQALRSGTIAKAK